MSRTPIDRFDGVRFIEATWPSPAGVRAGVTTRVGGYSQPPFDAFNLATHVGDEAEHVEANRRDLETLLALPESPRWLHQTHGTQVIGPDVPTDDPHADAAYTDRADEVLAVLTADCLSVTLTSHDGREVAVAHAGWRGLANGVIERAVGRFSVAGDEMMAWLGPAIGPRHFVVGEEVREAFMREYPGRLGVSRRGRAGQVPCGPVRPGTVPVAASGDQPGLRRRARHLRPAGSFLFLPA